jgi:hypothetical protein
MDCGKFGQVVGARTQTVSEKDTRNVNRLDGPVLTILHLWREGASQCNAGPRPQPTGRAALPEVRASRYLYSVSLTRAFCERLTCCCLSRAGVVVATKSSPAVVLSLRLSWKLRKYYQGRPPPESQDVTFLAFVR